MYTCGPDLPDLEPAPAPVRRRAKRSALAIASSAYWHRAAKDGVRTLSFGEAMDDAVARDAIARASIGTFCEAIDAMISSVVYMKALHEGAVAAMLARLSICQLAEEWNESIREISRNAVRNAAPQIQIQLPIP